MALGEIREDSISLLHFHSPSPSRSGLGTGRQGLRAGRQGLGAGRQGLG
ncbi:unnamed protein product, partial [Gulo gulo]